MVSTDTHEPLKFSFIDAIRGYAILMVIVCHSVLSYDGMVWPIKRLASLGWHGVQLFFVASSLTLLLSWSSRKRHESKPALLFFIRRWFRIAPMYFVAFAIYFLLNPPGVKFSWTQVFSTLTFVNAWSPMQTPTVASAWSSVPGSWSVSDEFGFYLLFPLLATYIRGLRSSLIFLASCLALSLILNSIFLPNFELYYTQSAASQFIYYWLPNQLPVFAIGFVVFALIGKLLSNQNTVKIRAILSSYTTVIIAASWVLFFSLAYTDASRYLLVSNLHVPIHIMASTIFAAIIVVMSLGGKTVFNNAPIQLVGRLSFSAYLVHFGVIHVIYDLFPGLLGVHTTGVSGVLHCVVFLLLVFMVTFSISWASYTFIEKPFIGLGKRVCVWVDERGWLGLQRRADA